MTAGELSTLKMTWFGVVLRVFVRPLCLGGEIGLGSVHHRGNEGPQRHRENMKPGSLAVTAPITVALQAFRVARYHKLIQLNPIRSAKVQAGARLSHTIAARARRR